MKRDCFWLVLLAVACSLAACSEDKEDEMKVPNKNASVAIATVLPNPDGMTGAAYLQLITDDFPQIVENSNAIPIPYGGSYPLIVDNDVYVFPSYMGDTKNLLEKYSYSNGILKKEASLKLPPSSSACNIVVAEPEKAYLALAGLGKIVIFNPKTMVQIGEIDLTDLGVSDKNPDPGIMLIRDNYLYVGLNQMVGGWVPKLDRYYSDVAIIDLKKDQLIKVITEKDSHISMPTRPIDQNTFFMDEKGDIYIVCMGAFGMVQGHKAGFLRIKKNQTDFDPSYKWSITGASIKNELKKGGFISSIQYWGNGKAYGYINMPGYYKKGEKGHNAIADLAVEFDLYHKTIKKIEGLELSAGWGVHVTKYKNKIAFSNSSVKAKGVYLLDPQTGIVEKESLVSTIGDIILFNNLKK